MMIDADKRVHLMGIGGIGMSGLAYILQDLGVQVSGCDRCVNDTCRALSAVGIDVSSGHHPHHLSDKDILVYSSAIREDEPELLFAGRYGIPVYRRAEFLGELIVDRRQICITGTHGKTTTAGMIRSILEFSGYKIGYLIGGHLPDTGRNGRWGEDQLFLLEADESDGTHILFSPYIGVITNIELDHTGFYKDTDMVEGFMRRFSERVSSCGYLVGCGDDERIRRIMGYGRKILYGFSSGNQVVAREVSIDEGGTRFAVYVDNLFWDRIGLRVWGVHNVLNALAGISVGIALGLDKQVIVAGLEAFNGIKRRMEVLVDSGVRIIDDYAHHPTEIENVIRTRREVTEGRIIVVFQPHRYTRVRSLWEKFGRCFDGIDQLVLLDIYPAGEDPIQGVDAGLIGDSVRRYSTGRVNLIRKEDTIPFLFHILKEGDNILFLGAGDITDLAHNMAKKWVEYRGRGTGKRKQKRIPVSS